MQYNTSVVLPVRQAFIGKQFWLVLMVLFAIFASAVAVVYVQAVNRTLFNELQVLQKARDNLRVEWGQLLVEQNTWSTQARVQQIAEQELAMVVPQQKDIVIIKE
jgi:cell division protein FtsL